MIGDIVKSLFRKIGKLKTEYDLLIILFKNSSNHFVLVTKIKHY